MRVVIPPHVPGSRGRSKSTIPCPRGRVKRSGVKDDPESRVRGVVVEATLQRRRLGRQVGGHEVPFEEPLDDFLDDDVRTLLDDGGRIEVVPRHVDGAGKVLG